jgi:hypothetical protein
MPSGFQNDANQIQSEMHRVVITMSNTTYYPTTGGAANDRGGVTPTSADAFATADLPTTLALSQNRSRGNMRFRNIVNQVTGLTDMQVRDITITEEADGDAQATSLAFTLLIERPEFIQTTGTAIDGSTALSTRALVLKNEIAKAIRLTTTASMRVFDPTSSEGTQESITVTHTGATASQTYGTVAVTLIDESTLFD